LEKKIGRIWKYGKKMVKKQLARRLNRELESEAIRGLQ